MKKLMIIFGLLLATGVAFGKPAYKQWGKNSVVEEWKEYDIQGAYAPKYLTAYKKGGKDGGMSVAVYVKTNNIAQKSVLVAVSLVTSEPIDFTVGDNFAFIGNIYTNEERVRDDAGEFFGSFVGLTGDIYKTKKIVGTNNIKMQAFVENGSSDGRYMYKAVFENINPEVLQCNWVYVMPTFKNPSMVRFGAYEVYSQYASIENDKKEAEKKAQALAEAEKQAKAEAVRQAFLKNQEALTQYPLSYTNGSSVAFRYPIRMGNGIQYMGYMDASKPEKIGDGIYAQDVGDMYFNNGMVTVRIQTVYVKKAGAYMIWFRLNGNQNPNFSFSVNDMKGQYYKLNDGTWAYGWVLNTTENRIKDTRQVGDFKYLRVDIGDRYYVTEADLKFIYILKEAVEGMDAMLVDAGVKK